MIKNNKFKLIIASVITVIPSVFGMVFWNKLPDIFPIHWGVDGNPDNFSSKPFAVFAIPIIMLVLFWVCIIATALDKKNSGQNRKAIGMVIWIVPFISLFSNGMIYSTVLGKSFDIFVLMPIILGLMFALIGNYLPKCKQNFTLGIRVKWTLESEENWNATHRFTGKLWVIGGLVIMLCVFLPNKISFFVMFLIIFILAIIPFIYSYKYYKNK